MAFTHRRFFFFGILALLLAMVAGSGSELQLRSQAHAAPAETFTQTAPPKLYAGDSSHGVGILAQAIPSLGLVGYCIDVQNTGISAVGLNNGFTITNGTIFDTGYYDPTTPADSTDDVYCATIVAAATGTQLTLSWTYTDGVTPSTISLTIPIVTVTLKGFDGFVGGRALVCTVGWDPSFLTGGTSDVPTTVPDPLDLVDAADWTLDATSIAAGAYQLGDPFLQSGEWCLAIAAPAAVASIDVTFTFHAVYNRDTNTDDQSHTITGTDIVNITDVPYSELRHVSLGGQLLETRTGGENVVGAMHYVCVIPSDSDDVLNAADIHFTNSGLPEPAQTSALTVFHNGSGITFTGVATGTICFGWTSLTTGEQIIGLTFTVVGGTNPGQRSVGWDTNGDGNGFGTSAAYGMLVKTWNKIQRTEITAGGDPRDPNTTLLTNGAMTVTVEFNVADGTFSSGSISLVEWVLGYRDTTTGRLSDLPLDGVVLVAHIDGNCGNFVSESDSSLLLGPTITGVSNAGGFDRGPSLADPTEPLGDGPDDIKVATDFDGGCNPASVIRVVIDAYYPGSPNVLFGTEYVDIALEFTVGAKTPRVAWAGQTVSISYGFSYTDSCGAAGDTVHFVRPEGQPGSFVGGKADEFSTLLGTDCSATVGYESETPGEVDIEVFLGGNAYSKVAFPIYFLALEDVVTTATPTLNVSERGDVSATVRGWFPGSSPSGRAAETKPDGRQVPADRWILPTDWETLRGSADFRQNWPSSPDMPITQVTFMMENEAVVNSFARGIKDGAAGWFLLDGTESSLNVNPHTGIPSELGTVAHPRILTDDTDSSGVGTVDSFGDFNLTFEGCPVNSHTGNPYCRVGDMAGHTRYYAVAEYPENKGQLPPAISNVAQSDWTWAGYKQLSVIDTDAAGIKYVVAHLKDRDGYCDAISFSNTLGIPIRWEIDAGAGIILDVQGDPSVIGEGRRSATTTTFDTKDDSGNVLNAEITKTVVADDECQAWIRISNSLLTPTNIRVTFPAPPSPVPGNIRITGITCSGPETITIKNIGNNTVSLAGFALRSRPINYLDPEEHLGIYGLLAPGESRIIDAGPNAGALGWLHTSSDVFVDGDPTDDVRLVWNEFEVSRMYCNSQVVNPVIPPTLPLDPEGEIVLDLTVQFGAQANKAMETGWNLVTAGRGGSITSALSGNEDRVAAIYSWDPVTSRWKLYAPQGPAFLNAFDQFEAGHVYWVQVKRPFTLFVPQ